ncbi:hypothetical protein G6L37_05120 [Agrobacterium rubi]|nr:hypothetical protein [Agrobacterium rubi]NTF24737.1 hypothetical protein [Agrobacterium rubi]
MRHDLSRLKELNAGIKQEATSLVVPIIPTISMMEAAADARDVFAPGDRLGDWILPQEEVDVSGDLTDPLLASRVGQRRAYELHVMAEIWAGCLSGLREWSTKRGIEGANNMVDGWFRPQVDTCPAEGWPSSVEDVNDCHRNHMAAWRGLPPFSHSESRIPHADLSYVLPAPRGCTSIMAMRAGQREFLMDYFIIGLDDVIDVDRLPFIPGYTIEHRYDDEERHRILAAAAWRGAIGKVNTLAEDDAPMPLPPRAASVYLSRLERYMPRSGSSIPGYFLNAPYPGLVFTAGEATFELSARGTELDAAFDSGTGQSFRMSGMDFRLPGVNDLMMNTVREMASLGSIDLKLLGLVATKD